jgi:hypothetical protein
MSHICADASGRYTRGYRRARTHARPRVPTAAASRRNLDASAIGPRSIRPLSMVALDSGAPGSPEARPAAGPARRATSDAPATATTSLSFTPSATPQGGNTRELTLLPAPGFHRETICLSRTDQNRVRVANRIPPRGTGNGQFGPLQRPPSHDSGTSLAPTRIDLGLSRHFRIPIFHGLSCQATLAVGLVCPPH